MVPDINFAQSLVACRPRHNPPCSLNRPPDALATRFLQTFFIFRSSDRANIGISLHLSRMRNVKNTFPVDLSHYIFPVPKLKSVIVRTHIMKSKTNIKLLAIYSLHWCDIAYTLFWLRYIFVKTKMRYDIHHSRPQTYRIRRIYRVPKEYTTNPGRDLYRCPKQKFGQYTTIRVSYMIILHPKEAKVNLKS